MSIEVSKEIVMKPVNEIKPYVRNPRKNDKTVEQLVKIIPVVGFNQPILIDKRGVIVKGHARFSAALKLGMSEVPCIISTADDEQNKLDRITDNKISELSEWVNEELLHELDSLNIDIDLDGLGLPKIDFEELEFNPMEAGGESGETPENGSGELSEDLKAKYEEFLRKQEEQRQAQVEKQIEKAEAQVAEPPVQKRQYFKVVCEKCGHTMFVRADEVMEV